MKTNTFNSTIKLIRSAGVVLLLSFLTPTASFAQVQNKESVFIGNDAIFYLGAGNYGFGTSATTKTARTADLGRLMYESGTGSTGASTAHNIDGYATFLGTAPFTMFLGQSNVLAPLQVKASASTGVTASFNKATPTNPTSLNTNISAISNSEYWDVLGVNTTISLSYRAATVANLPTALYTIVGYNTATSTWDIIPSVVDGTSFLGGTSNATSGSITSTADVNLATYRFFTVGSRGEICQPLVAFNGTTLKWTALGWQDNDTSTAVPAGPNAGNAVIIDVPYNGGSFTCNSIVQNADITLGEGVFIDCVNGVTNQMVGGTNKIILANTANFMQRNDLSTDRPIIELNKKTRDVMRRYDYVYWGTPIAGNFISQIALAQASQSQTPGAFDILYKYVSGLPSGTSGWQPLTATETGRGFIARTKAQAPFISAQATDYINMTFRGVANNGVVTVPIVNSQTSPNGGASHNLLANPYPSTLDADKFLTYNTDVDGVVYIWTAATSYPGYYNYAQSDYIAYTRLGSTVTSGITPSFNGKIASGQGFKVKSLIASGTATFNNCMRLTTDNNQFYRIGDAASIDRYKINMTGDNGVFSQILVGYTPETTIGYDRMFDATRNSVSTAQVYTYLDGTTTRLGTNARPTFVDTDKIDLGMLKNNTTPETFVFTIIEKEGIFNSEAVTVYLHDKIQDTFHNFNEGSFSFTTDALRVNDRFELVYRTNDVLTNPDFAAPETFIVLQNHTFTVSSTQSISSINIYDVTGRIIEKYSVNKNTFESIFNHAQGVYISKVMYSNGAVESKKLIHINK